MKTCGELYREAKAIALLESGDLIDKGFLIGQAEKVFLGACQACMSKSPDLFDFAAKVASLYGLQCILIREGMPQVRSAELWIYRSGCDMKWTSRPIDSAEWNLYRAAICGVPADRINLSYHGRKP